MGIRKPDDFYAMPSRRLTQLSDFPGSITALQYLRGNSAGTAVEFVDLLGTSNTWSAQQIMDAGIKLNFADAIQFIDANAQLLSLGSGSLLFGATGTVTITAAITDVNTGQFYANNGTYVGAPAADARTPFAAVETATLPGVYFRNSAPNDGGWVSIEDGASVRHRWGITGTPYIGDFRHTDNTRYCRWDASANLFTLESADGTNVHAINGTGETVFNEQGSDLDFRIESDTDTEIFFVDASTDRVGISTTTPAQTLDVQGNVIVSGEMMGSRSTISGGQNAASAVVTTGFMRVGNATMSATEGLVMTRPGSITGLSGLVTTGGFVNPGNMTFEVQKNGAVVYSVAVNVTAAGVFTATGTQARGTDTFAAGDVISLSWNNAGVYTKANIMMLMDMQLDS